MITRNDFQARDDWFASFSKGREPVGGEDFYGPIYWPELEMATTSDEADSIYESVATATALPSRLRGLRNRLSRFGV